MICNDPVTLVAAYADGEIGSAGGYSIGKHLRSCVSCASKYEQVLGLRAQFRAEVPRFVAPAALRARVRASLPSPRSTLSLSRPARDRWSWLAGGAAAGCAATMLAWVLGTAFIDGLAENELANEVVASHVRATLGNQLIQVASTDQHTVKPWLSARLDYSPPVRDLPDDGFALIGGRLDSLERRPVATLVYRYGQHTIDVYVRPESVHANSPTPHTVRGFNVAPATGTGMRSLAVSDIDADILMAFVRRIATESKQ